MSLCGAEPPHKLVLNSTALGLVSLKVCLGFLPQLFAFCGLDNTGLMNGFQ